jgi:hypothetical protein
MKAKLSCSFRVLALLTLVTLQFSNAQAQGTAFTYQGQLSSSGSPANGNYDLTFTLYPATASGAVIAGPVTNSATVVTNGLFTTTIDFGAGFTGTNYWLEIGVRTNGTGLFTALAPRQAITPTPYAIFATTASNVNGTISAAQISGAVASANLSGTYGNVVTLNNAGNNFYGSGANLTSLNASNLSSGTVPLATLPGSVPTSTVFSGLNGTTGALSIVNGVLNVTVGQTNLWPTTNAMNNGIVDASLPFTTCFTNDSFTFALPINVQANGYNQPVVDVDNYSGSVITITPEPNWHALLGTWNCTNHSIVSLFIYPGVMTNAICTPLF